MELSIANVINISVSEQGAGLGKYNTSNLALVTTEQPGSAFASGYAIYLSPDQVALDFGSSSVTYQMALQVFSQQPNILANNGYLVVIPQLVSETVGEAVLRTKGLVQFFGVISSAILSQTDQDELASMVQADSKIAFVVSKTAADIDVGGKLDLLRSGGLSHTRGLYYGGPTDLSALLMMAAYAGRALSTNFAGNNTTQTMHLKDLANVQPDPTITETLLAKAKAAGADTYASFQGVSKVFCSGANRFFDSVYNLLWLVGDLKIAGFNLLAQTSTKIVQTEDGVIVLTGAYRKVCEQAVSNQYAAPGTWTSPNFFGIQSDLLANIAQRGYYIYATPVSKQSAATRDAREAPLVQIAIKEAGAMHSSSVIVNINK